MKVLVLSTAVFEPAGHAEILGALGAIEYTAKYMDVGRVKLFDIPDDTKRYEVKVVPLEEEK